MYELKLMKNSHLLCLSFIKCYSIINRILKYIANAVKINIISTNVLKTKITKPLTECNIIGNTCLIPEQIGTILLYESITARAFR